MFVFKTSTDSRDGPIERPRKFSDLGFDFSRRDI